MSISRRDFISLVGASVAGATAVAVGSQLLEGQVGATTTVEPVGDWSVAEVGQVDRGALPFVLENRTTGERLRIEACRHGARLEPVARSAELDLFVANNGDGSARTVREHQLVARALARKIDSVSAQVPVSVTSMDARHAQHRGLFTTADDLANA